MEGEGGWGCEGIPLAPYSEIIFIRSLNLRPSVRISPPVPRNFQSTHFESGICPTRELIRVPILYQYAGTPLTSSIKT